MKPKGVQNYFNFDSIMEVKHLFIISLNNYDQLAVYSTMHRPD
jgi:hypothetical protein